MIEKEVSPLRSRIMASVRGTHTKPEVLVRKFLHSKGFRFRLHSKALPGRPDIVLPKYRTVIFVHGCFWHFHECRDGLVPKTRRDWWLDKFKGNRERDRHRMRELKALGWKVIVVWECATTEADLQRVVRRLLR